MNKETLLNAEENWVTGMGAWFPGETVIVRGNDLFTDLRDCSWMELLMLMVTGQRLEPKKVELLDRMWALAVSYPDPRLWNNRIASLAGSARSTGVLGVAAATAVSEANVYGKQADMRAYDFLVRMKSLCDAGEQLKEVVFSELKNKRSLGGFGRPLVRRDERIVPILELLAELGFQQGPHLKLVLTIEELLENSRYKMSMNVGGLVAAICCDLGFSMREYYGYIMIAFSAGHVACYFDALDHPEGSFFPLRCSRIDYKGIGPRKWQ